MIYTIFSRVITPFSFLFSFWTQNHSLLVFFLWNISALKWGTRVSFEFGPQLLKHIGIRADERRLTSTWYRIDTFRYRTRYRIDTKIVLSTRHYFKLGLSVTPPTVAGSTSPSLPLGIPTQGLSCYVGWWFPQRMAYPAPLPLEDLFGQRFLPCSFPQVSVAYSVWPSDAKDTAKTGVGKALDLLV